MKREAGASPARTRHRNYGARKEYVTDNIGKTFSSVDIQVGRPACLSVQKYSYTLPYFMPRVIGSTYLRMELLIFLKSCFMRLFWCALFLGRTFLFDLQFQGKGTLKMKLKKIISFIAAAALAVSMTACSEDKTRDGGVITSAEFSVTEAATETGTDEVSDALADETIPDNGAKVIADREGGVIQVPNSINTIISTAPSITEILVGLDAGNKIIAADTYSSDVEGISPDICTLDFSNLNIEELTALSPDVIIISGMSITGAEDPYAALKDAGVNVIYVPTSSSIESVKLDIEFLAGYVGAEARGAELIADINTAVAEISLKASQITEKKKVYFEIGAAPYLYTCGSGTFIDEVITLIGAENIYGGEEGWISNSEESVIAANPDVIVTNVAYDGYDFNEIKSRAGWENIPAVQNGAVFCVNANATSRPSQHIVEGIMAVAEAVYPEIYS